MLFSFLDHIRRGSDPEIRKQILISFNQVESMDISVEIPPFQIPSCMFQVNKMFLPGIV